MEEIKVYAGLVLYNQKRFEICEFDAMILPNGMYKVGVQVPKDRNSVTTAIHPKQMGKRIYLNQSKNVNFIFYSLDRNEVILEVMRSKEDYIKLQNSLIEERKSEIAELNKQINKYYKRIDEIEQNFSINSVNSIHDWN